MSEKGYLQTKKLCVGYQKHIVVDNIEISLEQGEILTLIGPNGAGKSTVLKSIARQLETLGGSIYQDISLAPEPCISHFQQTFHRSAPSHKVTFTENSILYKLFGSYTFTNSYHHQIIHTPALHLIPSAFTDDGVIEALESDAHTFALGIQWHPECMYDSNPDMCALFDLFIAISCKNE